MKNETLTLRQLVCLLFMFFFGSTAIMGMGPNVEQDSWITIVFSFIGALPFALLFGRLRALYPNRGFYELLYHLFGPVFGLLFTALMGSYSFLLCSLVLRNFSEFIMVSVMPATPQIPLMLLMILVSAYLVRSGIETMGKWSVLTMPIIALVVIGTILLSLNKMDFTRILPIMSHSFGDLVVNSYPFLSFPFLEMVVFVCAFQGYSREDGPYKGYLIALSLSALSLLLIDLRNLLVLGTPVLDSSFFPSYLSAKVISIGSLISRLEGSISMNFILGGVAKVSVSLLASTRSLAHLFQLKDHRGLLLPLGLLAVALGPLLFSSTGEMFHFIKVYPYFVFPFQVAIPILIWIFAEVKSRQEQREQLPSVENKV